MQIKYWLLSSSKFSMLTVLMVAAIESSAVAQHSPVFPGYIVNILPVASSSSLENVNAPQPLAVRYLAQQNPQTYYKNGNNYYKQGKFDLAIAEYGKAIKINPNFVRAYNNRGITYARLKKWDLALTDFKKAIEIDPKNVRAYYNRATVRAKQNKSNLALADYNKAIQLDPNYASAYKNRGIIYKNLNKKTLARESWQKAADIYKKQGKTQDYQKMIALIQKLNSN